MQPLQICKGEETCNGQAGVELVTSCTASCKELITVIL